METVISKIKQCGVCDFMVIDTGSCLDKLTKAVLETSDKIVVVQRNSENADAKMKNFDEQIWTTEHRERMVLVKNFAESNKKNYELQLPVIGVVHSYGSILNNDLLNSIGQENGIYINDLLQ